MSWRQECPPPRRTQTRYSIPHSSSPFFLTLFLSSLTLSSLYVMPLPAGTPALTSRGMTEEDIGQVTQFLHKGILITQQAKSDHETSLKTADPPTKPTTKVFHCHLQLIFHSHSACQSPFQADWCAFIRNLPGMVCVI